MQEDLEDAAAFIATTFTSILSQPKSTCQRGWRRRDAAQVGGRAGRRMDIFHPHRQWKQSTAGRRVKSSPSVHSARRARLSRAFWPSSLLPALSLPLSQLEGWALLLSALAAPKKVSQASEAPAANIRAGMLQVHLQAVHHSQYSACFSLFSLIHQDFTSKCHSERPRAVTGL